MSTGWTWDYVLWNVDLPRLGTMSAYWRENPPVHVLKAMELEYKPPQKVEINEVKMASDMEQMFEAMPMARFPKPVATIKEEPK